MPHPSSSNPAPARFIEPARRRGRGTAQRGLSLVELIVAIVIVSVGMVGVFSVFNTSVRNSADPMVRKQALSIAEAMLNEVLAQPFSYCDPQDPANDAPTPPASTAACTGGAAGSQDKANGALGPQPGSEGRFNPTNPLDNVGDYNGYTMAGTIFSLDNGGQPIAALSGPTGYTVTVAVARDRSPNNFNLPNGAVLRITVRVVGKGSDISLTGYRFRYAPNVTG